METDYLNYQLKTMAQAVSFIDQYTAEIKNSICVLLGYSQANCNAADISIGNGYDNLTEEVKLMIIDLKIKGSVRERANGLIELRTQAFGSIYGRTREEIESKLNQKIKEAKSHQTAVPTLSEFFTDTYLPHKQQTVSANQLHEINRYYTLLIENGFNIRLSKITALQIEKYLFTIDKTRTRQVARGVINNILTYAKQLGVIKNNPCDNVTKVAHETKKGRAMSFADQYEFFNALYNSEKITLNKKLYYTFVYLTGARRTEALSVKHSDINYNNNTLHIPGTKTKTSDRDIPLFQLVRQLTKKTTPNPTGLCFTINKDNATHDIKQASEAYHLHELRHTFGTIAVCVQKLDPNTVALYMGHSDPYMTLKTYTHPEQLDRALFFDGSKSNEEKLEILRDKYSSILEIISTFLDSVPNSYPN